MAVRLRLRQQGLRNHPYWWIIAQKHKANPQGRYLEHLGFWIPRECMTVDRAIILNRPRLKYWLSVGAQPTDGVMHLFGLTGFLPPRPPKYGTDTLYTKPERISEPLQKIYAKKYGRFAGLNWEQVANQEHHREEMRAQQMSFTSDLLFGTDLPGSKPPKEDAEKVQELLDDYKRLLEATERKVQGVTNDQRSRLYDLLESNVHLGQEEPASIQDLIDSLGVTQGEAEEILDHYYALGTVFTKADIESNLDELAYDEEYKGNKTEL